MSSVLERRMREGATGEPVELARYQISSGARILRGQRILGVVRVSDVPADGGGRRYLVEREIGSMAELEALVADYLQQAAKWDAIPAVPCCFVLDEEPSDD